MATHLEEQEYTAEAWSHILALINKGIVKDISEKVHAVPICDHPEPPKFEGAIVDADGQCFYIVAYENGGDNYLKASMAYLQKSSLNKTILSFDDPRKPMCPVRVTEKWKLHKKGRGDHRIYFWCYTH